MAIAEFGTYKMDVSGYMISMALRPGRGIDGNFFVYVVDRVRPPEKPKSYVSFKSGGQEPKDKLVITGDGINYSFRDISLARVVVAATMSERVRLFEFRYPRESTDKGTAPMEVKNSSQKDLKAGVIGDDLRYSVEGKGSAKYLYGASAEVSAAGRAVVRLDTLRNNSNSILEKLIETNTSAPDGGMIKAFTVECGQMRLKLDHTSLEWAFVTEAFGTCLEWKRPALTDYLGIEGECESLVRADLDGPTKMELLQTAGAGLGVARGGVDKPMESATFCLAPGTILEPMLA